MGRNDFPAAIEKAAQPPDMTAGPSAPEQDNGDAIDKLQAFADGLLKKRDLAIQARVASRIERRWTEDLDAYHGRDSATRTGDVVDAAAAGQASTAGRSKTGDERSPRRSTVFVNITRSKTNAAEARLADMLFPVDERNWGISPTPVPELVAQVHHQDTAITHMGQPVVIKGEGGVDRPATAADLAQNVIQEAEKRCEAMQKEIDDQLTECEYNGIGRSIIHDAAMLGVGVIKGPVVTSRTKKVWQPISDGKGGAVHVLQLKKDLKPASERISPWDFFPDPACGENIKSGSHTWERRYANARYLRGLVDIPGYLKDQIAKVLEEGPSRATANQDSHQAQIRAAGGYPLPDATTFEIWEYHGEANKEDLEAAGCDCGDDQFAAASACVIVINKTVIRADIEVLDSGELPYDAFPWEKVDGSWAGFGVPYLMRYAQRVLNAAWRAMMDNAGQTVGPQIVMKKDMIEPADGRWEIMGRKIWWLDDEEEDVSKAFKVFEISSNQQEYMAIIKAAIQFADEETSLPMLAQGERGSAPDTVGGMTLLMNSANVVLRRLVKQFDDMVTRPHIDRYYDWNMQYSSKSDIKGDFQVQAMGSTALVIRDQQDQTLMDLLKLAKDPFYGVFVKAEEILKKVLESKRVPAGWVMRTEEEIKQKQKEMQEAQPKASPDAQVRADAMVKSAELRTQAETAHAQASQQETAEELAFKREQMQADRDHEMNKLLVQRDIMAFEYSQKSGISLQEIKAQLAKTAMIERTRKDIAGLQHLAKSRQPDVTPEVSVTT